MFAVLHVSDFALQAILRIERELAGRAVALIDEMQRPPCVIACTSEARTAGVEPGQTAPQAMARCADVMLRTRQPAAETEARAGLLAAAFAVSPHVEDTAPGVCTIDVSALAEERREPALCAAVEQLEKLGLRATAGLAPAPLLALYAARFGGKDGVAGRSLQAGDFSERTSNIACEQAPTYEVAKDSGRAQPLGAPERDGSCGPALPVVIKTGEERMFLRDLPLVVAEPTAEIASILTGWGVKTLGQLTALTKADVTQRLGPEGLALWERAVGESTRPLQRLGLPQTFTAELELENEIETLEPLLFVLRRFVDRLALELRNAGFVAGELVLGLSLSDETVYTREFRLPEPTAQEEILFRVLHTHLETLHTAATVEGVALECRPVRPLVRQQGLFESGLRDPQGFAETLGRIAAVVGADRVGAPVVENTHRPDAVRVETPAAVVEATDMAAMSPATKRRGAPLRRYRPPLSATVELAGTAPAFVWAADVIGAVKAANGPWRGSGEWWEAGRRWAREEWDVELETGGVYRLIRTAQGWFVEGEYD